MIGHLIVLDIDVDIVVTILSARDAQLAGEGAWVVGSVGDRAVAKRTHHLAGAAHLNASMVGKNDRTISARVIKHCCNSLAVCEGTANGRGDFRANNCLQKARSH